MSANTNVQYFTPPTTCPSCGAPTKMDGEYLVCPNTANCEAQVSGAIKRWVKKVGVLDVGDALIEALCTAGLVSTPADLYKLTVEDVAALQLSGRKVGAKTAKTAITNLHAKKVLPLHVLVGSLGIPLWSRSMVKVLVEAGYDTIEAMASPVTGDLACIPGIGEIKAAAFVDGFRAVHPLIDALLAVGITVAKAVEGNLKGLSVCMTGFRDAKMSTAIEAAGGSVKSGVVKGLHYLVAKNPSGSSGKLDAARASGTKVISIEEMWAILGGQP